MHLPKVLLYLASNSPFYTQLFLQIKEGFEEAGLEVIGGPNLLQDTELVQLVEEHKPLFVFEMNRSKNEIKSFPKEVMHVCWLVDFWGRKHYEIEGSDILYCWSKSWVKAFENQSANQNVLFLPPATSSKSYYPLAKEKTNDFLFLGHIPNPWNNDELMRPVGILNGQEILFKELLPLLKKYALNKELNMDCHSYLKKHKVILKQPVDKVLEYDISSRTQRQVRREAFVKLFLKKGFLLSVFGSENWLNYELFKEFYKGYIDEPSKINEELAKTNILLHDGNYPHFRTFDAMAAKCCVATCETPSSHKNSWLDLGFKEDEDYIKVEFFSQKVDFNKFKNKKLLNDIAYNAYNKVKKSHLWVHRAETILLDIEKLRSSNV